MLRSFRTFDLSGPYTNSTIYLPSKTNFDYLEFFISEDTTGAGLLAKQVWYQIEAQILTLKGLYPAVREFYSGSFFNAPPQWSPASEFYVSDITDKSLGLKGASVA